jgi:hypothetical protein
MRPLALAAAAAAAVVAYAVSRIWLTVYASQAAYARELPAGEAALLELVRADGYQHARVVANGALVIVDADRRGKRVLLALHDRAATTPPPLVLDRALPPRDARLQARLQPLFGRADLIDVIVDVGWGGNELTTDSTHHYVVRVGLLGDALVCDFESDSTRYGIESSISWSGRLRKVRDTPLSFDLVQTFSRAQMGGGNFGDPPGKTTHVVLGDGAHCSATVETAQHEFGIGSIGVPKKRRAR